MLVAEETAERMERVFSVHGTPMPAVSLFCYLGRTLLSSRDDWPAVERNLRRAQVKWGRLAKILGREGADRRTAGRFYVAVVQVVLLFGSETWVLTPWLEKFLEGFCHRAARRMAGMGPKCQRDGIWVYPPTHWGGSDKEDTRGDQGIYRPPPEYSRTIHCVLTYHGFGSGGGEEAGNVPIQSMVGETLPGYPEDKGGACSNRGG